MKLYHLALLLLPAAAAPALAGDNDQHATAVARARELLQLLVDEKFAEFHKAGTDELKANLPADKVAEIWKSIGEKMGAYGKEMDYTAEVVLGDTVVALSCRFERADLIVRIVIDAEGRMSGLWFAPDTSRVEYDAPAYVDQSKFREEEVTVSAGRFALPGTITLPKTAQPEGGFPAVVLVHGSGPQDRDETIYVNKPFRDLAWGLATRGIAVLRYEKRTFKHPTAHTDDNITLDDETIEDAVAAVKLLMDRGEINPRRVCLLGHSLGAVAAPFVALQQPELAGVIMLAGCSRPLTDVIEDQVEYVVAADGKVTDEERAEVEKIKKDLAEVRAGKLDGDDAVLPRKYLHMLKRYDTVAAAGKLTLPTLIAQGKRDYQVNMKDWDLWRESLKDKSNITFRLFEKCNHLFIAGEGPSTPEEYMIAGHVAPGVIDTLANWITNPQTN